MRLTVVGSGDAFGSGGRLQTCYHVAAAEGDYLIDCGATALIGMQKLGLDPDRVGTIFISHLHGDHFGGLVWWLLHAHYVSGRTAPLAIVGPAGIAQRFAAAAEALFPNSTQIERRFAMTFIEHAAQVPLDVGGATVTPFEVMHPSGAIPYALRFACDGKVLSFSGDTKWVETLVAAAKGADLFICESFGFERPTGYHMSWRDVADNIDRLGARRILLTHMGPDMLAHRDEVRDERVLLAEDGLVIDI
ncbi:MAG: MBL fold metallo-hydrolase [Hyphomicrobium sp.]|jgi:ribonuclease BN (tRNA processing enzyme)